MAKNRELPEIVAFAKSLYILQALSVMERGVRHELPRVIQTAARLDPSYDTEAVSVLQKAAFRLGVNREELRSKRELAYLSPDHARQLMGQLASEGFIEVVPIAASLQEEAYALGYGRAPHEDYNLYSLAPGREQPINPFVVQ